MFIQVNCVEQTRHYKKAWKQLEVSATDLDNADIFRHSISAEGTSLIGILNENNHSCATDTSQ